MNYYNAIKKILSTGVHYVEVEFEAIHHEDKRFEVDYAEEIRIRKIEKEEDIYAALLHGAWHAYGGYTIKSIRRIPIKPNVLPVGTVVDVTKENGEEYSGMILDIFMLNGGLEKYRVGSTPMQEELCLPWQVVPHIEEEGEVVEKKLAHECRTDCYFQNRHIYKPNEEQSINSQDTIHSEEESMLKHSCSKGCIDTDGCAYEEQKLPSELIDELGGRPYAEHRFITMVLDHLAKKNNWKV